MLIIVTHWLNQKVSECVESTRYNLLITDERPEVHIPFGSVSVINWLSVHLNWK